MLDSLEQARKCNAFEHLWRSVFPYKGRERLMVMLAIYFDESESNAPNVPRVHTVAGYLSTVERWEAFSIKWQKLLDDANLPSFSMKKFCNPHDKHFGSWSDSRKKLFLRILHKLIKEARMFGIASNVSLEAFDSLTSPQKWALGHNYSFAAVDCLKRFQQLFEVMGMHDDVAYVFEQGSQHQRQLKNLLLNSTEDQRRFYHIGSVTFGEKHLQPLQAADMLAYESRKEMGRQLSGGKRPARKSIVNLCDDSADFLAYYTAAEFEHVFESEAMKQALSDPRFIEIAEDEY